jgi:hypothetical protein
MYRGHWLALPSMQKGAERMIDRNMNPTPQAVAAMWLYGKSYSEQRGGCMDFWDKLDGFRKSQCESLVAKILAAAVMHGTCAVKP